MQWPRGLAFVGLSALLLGAWGALVPFVGPLFSYSANGSPSWHWSTLHGVLYVAPGAIAVLASLIILSRARGGRGGAARVSVAFAGLVLVACGAWFVLGPAAWPALGGAGIVFGPAATSTDNFVNQVGYNLGVGVLLAALGGISMKAVTGERDVAVRSTQGVEEPAAGVRGAEVPVTAAPLAAETLAASETLRAAGTSLATGTPEGEYRQVRTDES